MSPDAPQTSALAAPFRRHLDHLAVERGLAENTLAAFRLGAQHGYRMFECDVKLSSDGVPFLLHDATLARTTNVPTDEALAFRLIRSPSQCPGINRSSISGGRT